MTATPGIPDGMSFADLQALIQTAQSEDDVHQPQEPVSDDDKQQLIQDIAGRHLQNALDELDDPIVHKVMAFHILSNFVAWHQKVAMSKIEDGEMECASAWMKDAGKFQACMNILSNVTVGPDDFTVD